MDYRAYHAINGFVVDHSWLGRLFGEVEKWGVPVLAVATFALWLLARPGADRKWKLASASALASAAVALLVNQVISHAWHRDRPFITHPSAHVWGARKTDASFPSDHASAAFGIAFAVLLFDTVAGAIFVVAAVLITVGRVLVGAHYPADVVAGCLVGIGSALIVVRLARPAIGFLVGIAERLTDPLLRPFWARRAR